MWTCSGLDPGYFIFFPFSVGPDSSASAVHLFLRWTYYFFHGHFVSLFPLLVPLSPPLGCFLFLGLFPPSVDQLPIYSWASWYPVSISWDFNRERISHFKSTLCLPQKSSQRLWNKNQATDCNSIKNNNILKSKEGRLSGKCNWKKECPNRKEVLSFF